MPRTCGARTRLSGTANRLVKASAAELADICRKTAQHGAKKRATCQNPKPVLSLGMSRVALRRVSEWLAATLEMSCRETGCGFESRALRSPQLEATGHRKIRATLAGGLLADQACAITAMRTGGIQDSAGQTGRRD